MQHMNIIALSPKTERKIPVYSKGMVEREEQIKAYYQYCKIRDVYVDGDNMEILPLN